LLKLLNCLLEILLLFVIFHLQSEDLVMSLLSLSLHIVILLIGFLDLLHLLFNRLLELLNNLVCCLDFLSHHINLILL